MVAIFWKEMADHFGRRRFVFLLALVFLAIIWALSVIFGTVEKAASSREEFLFLKVFSSSSDVLPSLLFFISFFGPLAGIILGFDSINSERSQGTLARILSQPVHRDEVYNGKFLAGLTTLAVIQISTILAIVGATMASLGIVPDGEEIVRLIGFAIVSITYLGLWLAVSMSCSIFFRSTVVSAMVAIGLWLLSTFFLILVAGAVADFFVGEVDSQELAIEHFNLETWISRISPSFLFSEASDTLLNPTVRSLGVLLQEQTSGLLGSPISAVQSLRLVWPHIVAMISAVVVFLAVSYTKFMREEIRS